jgi:hypothetical protein
LKYFAAYTKEIGPSRAPPRIKSFGNHLRILGELGASILEGPKTSTMKRFGMPSPSRDVITDVFG